jgi:hypothetical protein
MKFFGMKSYGILGLLLLLVGTTMLIGVWDPLTQATVIYTGPTVIPLNPSGTLATPTPIVAGGSTTLAATITQSGGTISKAQCQVKDESGANVTLFTLYAVGDNWISNPWTLPATADKVYACVFTAWNTAGGSASATGYFKTTSAYPSGDFYINDVKATISSIHSVISPDLALKFVALLNGNKITVVTCKLFEYTTGALLQTVTLTETTTDVRWEGTLTLPASGKYTLSGYISDGTTTWQLMSALVDNTGSSFTLSQLLGMGLDLLGLLFVAKDRKLIKLW